MMQQAPLHYTMIGDSSNPAIFFLHGFMGSGGDWMPIAEDLAHRYCSVLVDLPGHGKSLDGDDRLYSLPGCTEALISLMDDRDMSNCHIAGYSMGGRVALYLALKHPKRCRKVVIESGSPGLENAAEALARCDDDERRAQMIERGFLLKFLEEWLESPMFVDLKKHPDYDALLAERMENDPTGLAKSVRLMGVGKQPSLWDLLKRLEIPLLYIAGKWDKKFVTIGKRMRAVSSLITMAVIPNAGHIAHFEQPEEFSNLIKEFLS